jgi:hypothetical protein
MKEIIILDDLPIVLTKDRHWRPKGATTQGAIVFLPEDAILVIRPIIKEVKNKN